MVCKVTVLLQFENDKIIFIYENLVCLAVTQIGL